MKIGVTGHQSENTDVILKKANDLPKLKID